MKKKTLGLFFIVYVLIFSICLGVFPKSVYSVPSDIEFDFRRNNLYNTTNIQYSGIYNLRNLSSGIYEVNRWEWGFEALNDMTDQGDDNVNGWIDVETGGDEAHIHESSPCDVGEYDNSYRFKSGEMITEAGIERYDLDYDGNYINCTAELYIERFSNTAGKWFWRMYDNASNQIYLIRIRVNAPNIELQLYDFNTWVTVKTDLTNYTIYGFNIFINYTSTNAITRYWVNGTFDSKWEYELYSHVGKYGFKGCKIYSETTNDGVDNQIVHLDNTGIYYNNVSQSDELGYSIQQLSLTDEWDYQHHNLYQISAEGYFDTHLTNNSYVPETTDWEEIYAFWDYTTSRTSNLYWDSSPDYANPYLVFTVRNYVHVTGIPVHNFSINSLDIHGVQLNDSRGYVYWGEYYSSAVSNDANYFYVVNDRLRFSIEADSTALEYIQVNFNILKFFTLNRSVAFTSDYNGLIVPYLRFDFSDGTSSGLDFSAGGLRQNIILEQDKEIDELIIVVSDNALLNDTISNGLIRDITLIYIPDSSISITISSLILILLPLLVILVPTLGVYYFTDKNKVAFFFTFMLMTIICFIAQLIPTWLFVLMLFGFFGFVILEYKRGGFE